MALNPFYRTPGSRLEEVKGEIPRLLTKLEEIQGDALKELGDNNVLIKELADKNDNLRVTKQAAGDLHNELLQFILPI